MSGKDTRRGRNRDNAEERATNGYQPKVSGSVAQIKFPYGGSGAAPHPPKPTGQADSSAAVKKD